MLFQNSNFIFPVYYFTHRLLSSWWHAEASLNGTTDECMWKPLWRGDILCAGTGSVAEWIKLIFWKEQAFHNTLCHFRLVYDLLFHFMLLFVKICYIQKLRYSLIAVLLRIYYHPLVLIYSNKAALCSS